MGQAGLHGGGSPARFSGALVENDRAGDRIQKLFRKEMRYPNRSQRQDAGVWIPALAFAGVTLLRGNAGWRFGQRLKCDCPALRILDVENTRLVDIYCQTYN